MSWHEAKTTRATIGRLLTTVMIAFATAGCLRPMYAPSAAATPAVQTRLAGIVVEPLPERLGHYLVQEIRYELDGSGGTTQPKYRLTLTANERLQAAIVNSQTGRATSATLAVDATFTLTQIDGGVTIVSGTAFASASYDRTQQRYAAIRAARDAEIRIARTLAEQIRTRIAAHFATQG
jgi:LPS-assembly lipoprotein